MTLNNLGLLYSNTQRLTEGEQAYQEALSTYRQLAQANPQAYLPDVAMTLNNLGILKFDQEEISQAQALIAEALTIRRGLWKQHTVIYGNDLAQSLAIDIMILQRKEEARTLICERLHEMATVALRENLKQWAKAHTEKRCKSGQ
jgi:tetratricopeptide (TPR) repeat protein